MAKNGFAQFAVMCMKVKPLLNVAHNVEYQQISLNS